MHMAKGQWSHVTKMVLHSCACWIRSIPTLVSYNALHQLFLLILFAKQILQPHSPNHQFHGLKWPTLSITSFSICFVSSLKTYKAHQTHWGYIIYTHMHQKVLYSSKSEILLKVVDYIFLLKLVDELKVECEAKTNWSGLTRHHVLLCSIYNLYLRDLCAYDKIVTNRMKT